MSKKLIKIENNLMYLQEQVEKFLKYEYRINYKIDVFGNKKIEKEGYLTRTIFSRGKPVGIDVAYSLLLKGKETMLKEVLREAVRVALWHMRKPYGDGSGEFAKELKRKGLKYYGTVSHVGKELHTYVCSSCKKIYMLKERKLPNSKDPAIREIYTPCCEVRFAYEGKVFYNNEKLQKMARRVRGGK